MDILEKVEQESLTDAVEKKIYDYLERNRFQPGRALPQEGEFAEMLGVSRSVVREALSRFKMMGLVSARKRRGMVAGRPSVFETISKVVNPAFLKEEEQRDFFRIRLAIEIGMADELVANQTDEDLAALEEIVAREEVDPADFTLALDCDYQFHSRLYQATHNRALASFQEILLAFFNDPETRKGNASPNFAERFENPEMVSHRDLLWALRCEDAAQFRELMCCHFRIYLKGKR